MKRKLFFFASFAVLPLPIQQTISCEAESFYMLNPVDKNGATFYVEKSLLNNDGTLTINPYWIIEGGFTNPTYIDILIDNKVVKSYSPKTALSEEKDNTITTIDIIRDNDDNYNLIKQNYMQGSNREIYNLPLMIKFNNNEISNESQSSNIIVKMFDKKYVENKPIKGDELTYLNINITLNYSKF
ncbi:hypothetical protein [Spiroplasma endosymbiont of Aspidapion aeneum]|uniref:hypothetical protein n=1 Tax=Spiroplasma endosymbiont of Aspidapion aeneum TaxID=3066276 RepID=UPI00313E66AB